MEDPKSQLVAKLKEANNVLVTVSNNPSVDQLSAAIGFTLMLNKMGKHATAVFSGAVPSTIEFLEPEKTIEKNTDSLRDFIISLDKAKADKLRYKVEDKMVKIFITPYRTSIGQADLIFSQGDFNVDIVVALGAHAQQDLDLAITSHGRILHDATVSSVNNTASGSLGTINWVDTTASSICELVGQLVDELKADALDSQMATALLTGIVAETKRFSNEKTTSTTMSMSAKLMAAGANQQLVATKLQEPAPAPPPPPAEPVQPVVDVPEPAPVEKPNDGSLDIDHEATTEEEPEEPEEEEVDQIHIDEHGTLRQVDDELPQIEQPQIEQPQPPQPEPEIPAITPIPSGLPLPDSPPMPTVGKGSRVMLEPPSLGGKLTANTDDEALDPGTDPLSGAPVGDQPILSHDESVLKSEESSDTALVDEIKDQILPPPVSDAPAPEPPVESPIPDTQTLSSLEQAVDSPHQEGDSTTDSGTAPFLTDESASQDTQLPDLDAARDAVVQAATSDTGDDSPLPPIEALNANPVNLDLHDFDKGEDVVSTLDPAAPPNDDQASPEDAPPVPPPMMPAPPPDDGSSPQLPPVQY